MPINYGTNDVTTTGTLTVTGLANVDNLRLDGNTLSSTNSNGSIIIQPSGTGALQRDSGGNARGQYAVDWQTVRSTGTMVAGGNYSIIGGGRNNTSSGTYSTVPGGFRGKSTRYGELSHAAGRFSVDGDAQHSIFVLRGKTTNASQTTTLGLDGTTSSRLTITSNTILSGTINIVGSISTGASVARYLRQFSIKNVGGTTSLIGSIITLGTDEAAGTTIAITADDTNDALQIQVTRSADETWRWVAVVDAVSMEYGT